MQNTLRIMMLRTPICIIKIVKKQILKSQNQPHQKQNQNQSHQDNDKFYKKLPFILKISLLRSNILSFDIIQNLINGSY